MPTTKPPINATNNSICRKFNVNTVTPVPNQIGSYSCVVIFDLFSVVSLSPPGAIQSLVKCYILGIAPVNYLCLHIIINSLAIVTAFLLL